MLTRALLPGVLFAMATLAAGGIAAASPAAPTVPTIMADAVDHPIQLDGEIDDWAGVAGTIVPLSGHGGADRIYVLATWDDATQSELHKPYRWNEASQSYEKTDRMEDRFALSMPISGESTANKLDGSEFTADVWHWKANRSNPVGLAHDKSWRVSRTPFEGYRAFETPGGGVVHLHRPSDAGDRLYKIVRYYVKEGEIMPGYEVDGEARGSIVDVAAKGVWRDGRWYVELSRLLDTGHDDDVVVPANGTISLAIALFDGVSNDMIDGGAHSVSELLRLETRAASS